MAHKAVVTGEPNQQVMVVERVFPFPIDLVYRCFTEKELLERCLSFMGMHTTFPEHDLRDGGQWRMVHEVPDGQVWSFRGVFHGEQTPEMMARTWEFEAMPGHVAFEKNELIAQDDGSTLARTTTSFITVEDRDFMLQSMLEGADMQYDHMESVMAEIAAE